jgi:hypothetical protein
MSDLHLESNHIGFPEKGDPEQVLLLIGDIVAGQKVWDKQLMDNVADLIRWANTFKRAIWIPGNHEYNNFEGMEDCHSFFRRTIDLYGGDRILFSDSGCEVMDDTAVIWATLWTDFNNDWAAKDECSRFHDFMSNTQLTPDFVTNVSDKQAGYISMLARKYSQEGKKVLVATHFPPSANFANSRGAITDAYFYRNCEYMFPDVDVWLYGHCHKNTDFESDLIRVMSNQLGYGHEGEGFDEKKTITL